MQAVATLGGRWDDGVINSAQFRGQALNSTIHLSMTGTDAVMFCSGGAATPFHVSVDGGAETNPTISGGQITLFSGLSDAAHTVMIRCGDAYSGGNARLTRPNCFDVTGSAPAISAFPNHGPKEFTTSTTLGQRTTGEVTASGYTSPNGAQNRQAEGIVRRGKAERIYVWVSVNFSATDELTLLIDGVHDTTTTVSPTNADCRWVLLKTGLDVSTEHEYTIISADGSSTPADMDAIMFGGTGAQLSSTAVTPKKRIAFWGDSITEGFDGITGKIFRTRGWAGQTCEILNCLPHNRGVSGNTIAQVDARIASELASLASIPGEPDLVVLNPGRNSWSTVSGTNATNKTNYRAMVDKAVAGTTDCPIVCLATWGTTGGGADLVGRLQMNQLISEVVTEVANARVFFQETDSAPTTVGTHFTLTENATAAAWLAPKLAPYIATGGSNYTTPVQGPYFSPGFSPLNPIISIAGG